MHPNPPVLRTPISAGCFGIGIGDYDNVKEAYENGRAVMLASTGEEPAPEGWRGYAGGHAYYVVGVTDDGNILIGNPWGLEDYPPIEATPEEFEEYFKDPTAMDVPE